MSAEVGERQWMQWLRGETLDVAIGHRSCLDRSSVSRAPPCRYILIEARWHWFGCSASPQAEHYIYAVPRADVPARVGVLGQRLGSGQVIM
jgi:hypothetical protein